MKVITTVAKISMEMLITKNTSLNIRNTRTVTRSFIMITMTTKDQLACIIDLKRIMGINNLKERIKKNLKKMIIKENGGSIEKKKNLDKRISERVFMKVIPEISGQGLSLIKSDQVSTFIITK